MKVVFDSEHFEKDFEIDLSKVNQGKGVVKVEVLAGIDSVPLHVRDGSGQIIREDYSTFILQSSLPIVSGLIRFEFKEIENLTQSNAKKSATVRYLYCDE
ncbi:hypothetical protein [Tenacibaculum maritimum]|uniref:hypothetical protein n=1 Tax=Tenacibaculum maritimum TaxID=107401 RepID=UPI0038771ACE